jgi:hypothetical protein
MSAAQTPPDLDDPLQWLGTSPLLDLDDPKLRLRAQSLTQLCKSEREKALVVYAFVKRIPYGKAFKMRLHTAREVLQQSHADAPDKATLLIALLRLAGLPARIRYLTLQGEVMRGLLNGVPEPTRPVVETFRDGRWIATDTYIFDASYLDAARKRLKANGWTWGYGIHVDGASLWDGNEDAYLGKLPPAEDPLLVEDHGFFCDTLEFVSSPSYREMHVRLARAVQWNMLSPVMERAIRELRGERERERPDPSGARTS